MKRALIEIGFIQAKANYSLLIKEKNQNITYLVVYKDDIILTRSNELEFSIIKIQLENKFK